MKGRKECIQLELFFFFFKKKGISYFSSVTKEKQAEIL